MRSPRAIRSTLRTAVTCAAALTACLWPASAIHAIPASSHSTPATPASLPRAVTALEQILGAERSAGVYLDLATGKTVVTITSPGDAAAVRAAGGVPVVVRHSGAQLREALTALARMPRLPGTAWAVNPVRNQVTVLADATVTREGIEQIRAATRNLADAVTVQRTRGRIHLTTAGGDPVYSSFRCTAGFNTHFGPYYFLLTAGHCGNAARYWFSATGSYIGPVVVSVFPSSDYAIVSYDGSVPHPSAVDLYGRMQNITTAADPYVGEPVERSGSTSHVHSGYVTAVNETVNYPEGTVTGLTETTVCAEPGDSGGPLFNGTAALGLTSGGDGDCQTGGITFYQPVTPILSAYGLAVG